MDIETLTQSETDQEVKPESLDTEQTETVESTEPKESDQEVATEEVVEETPEQIEQRKIKKGYKAKLERERARAYQLEQQLKELQSKVVQKDVPNEKPDPAKYESQADYIEALTDWKVGSIKRELEATKAKEGEIQKESKVKEDHNARVSEFEKETPDFRKVINEAIEDGADVSPTIEALIKKSDLGPAVLYELAKNQDELERLNSLDALDAAREFGKLEAKLSKPKQQVKKSAAPAPIKPITGTKTESVKNIYDPDLPFDEFEKLMDKLERENRKRA
jgi:hypothetical protein